MNTANLASSASASTSGALPPGTVPPQAPAAARSALRLLQRLQHGTLTVHLPDGSQRRVGETLQPAGGHEVAPADQLHASISVHDWKVFGAALKSGDIGFAESFIAGDWSTPDLSALLRVFAANRRAMEAKRAAEAALGGGPDDLRVVQAALGDDEILTLRPRAASI